MLAKPKKINKKQMKEDKLVTTYYKAYGLYENYQTHILVALGVIALVIVAAVFYSNKVEGDNREAAALMGEVLPLYEAGSYREALDGREGVKGLTFIAEEYGSTEQGSKAVLYAANSYYYLGEYDKALDYYEDYDGEDAFFKSAAIAGQGAANEALGNHDDAAELFQEAATVSDINPSNPSYLLSAGINYIEAGEKDEAEEVLQNLKKTYKTSQSAREADRYLAMADISEEVE